MHHILGNKVLEYDVDDRGVIVDEREYDRTVNPKPNIADWVKEHMVFWYDMSKPVDTYAENFNDWTKFAGTKCTVTNKSVNITSFNAINSASIYIDTSKKFNGITITVDGLLDGQEIAWGYDSNPLVRMPKNGTYTLEPIDSITGNISFRSINIVGACNITITQLPSGQFVPTNEILKANPYLQDFSGNNRPLKLNNFMFAAMSGVGGYEYNWLDSALFITYLSGARGDGTITDNTITINNVKVSSGVIETRVNSPSKKYKVRVTGITSNETLRYVVYGDTSLGELATIIFDMKKDGEYELPASTYSATYNMKWQVIAASYPHTCNITIEQIPAYPNALVTDGVDDYGVVGNFKSLQNYMMFYQCAVIKPTGKAKGMFSTISDSNNINGWVLLQNQGKNTSRFENGAYMNVQLPDDSEAKTDYIVTGNSNKMTLYIGDKTQTLNGTYTSTGSTMGFFLSEYSSLRRFGSLAFYKSILFDSVPTKETDGFTEQELIDYVLENLITK